jgi:predicted phage tail protein
MVGWNDPAEDFKQKWEYVDDKEGILRYGVRETDLVAFGCTSRTQARRAGLWLLYTQRLESQVVRWQASIDSSFMTPGKTAIIQDARRSGVRMGGRVASATTGGITIDNPIDLAAGSYTLSVLAPDGSVVTKTVNIAFTGTYLTLPVSVAFSTAPASSALWTLASASLSTMQVRIVGMRQVDKVWYEFTALENNESKYAAIELGAPLTQPNYSLLSVGNLPVIVGLAAAENSYKPTVTSPVHSNLEISWDAATDPMVRGYSIKVLSSQGVLTVYPEQRSPYLFIEDVTPGTFNIKVAAVNHFGNIGPYTSFDKVVTGIDTTAPADVVTASFTYVIEPTIGVRLRWVEIADFIDFYEIRQGATWASATPIAQVKTNNHPVGLLSGSTTFLIKAVDTSGNYSVNAASLAVTVNVPGTVAPLYAISGVNEVISWSVPTSAIAIDRYIIRYGATYAGGTPVDQPKTTSLTRKVDYVGARTYWIVAVDAAGGESVPASLGVNITAPGIVTSSRAEIVDNNVLLFWAAPSTGSLPIDRYEVRKGATWAGGTVVGSNAASTFCSVFEQQAGTFTYWITAFDSAGNIGTPVPILATVSQPPDYVLRTNIDSTFSGTKTNMILDQGALVGPVDTAETWSSHFSTRGYTTPQDQIDAGYPIYLQPSVTSGSYDETFDSGATLPSTTITATLGYTVITGSVTVACQIYYKLLIGDSWTAAAAGATSVLASNFRYYRVVWTFTCTAGANLISCTSFNVKLSSKLKNDSGTFTISNATTGVAVNFNVSFIDADTPIVQPNGTTPLVPVVDFTDVPNPTSFTVYLYNQAGAKVTGSGSWQARGF